MGQINKRIELKLPDQLKLPDRAWWRRPVILELKAETGRSEFEAILGYRER